MQKLRSPVVTLVCLWLLALAVRVYDIREGAPLTDERLWVSRSTRVLERLGSNPLNATTHLGHPEVPPALVMAAGLEARELLIAGAGPGIELLTPLAACRLGNAFVSSMITPALYAGVAPILGPAVGVAAALFGALDPHLVGNARLAHLDASMTLFVTCALLLYVHALRRDPESLRLKLAAGFSWGLAIATKPTAGLLPLLFLVYRSILRCSGRRIPVMTWSDIGAVVLGHAVYASVHTRLWWHESDYMVRLKIRNRLAGQTYQLGLKLQEAPLLTAALILACSAGILLLLRIRRSEPSRWNYHAVFLFVSAAAAAAALYLVPQVIENLVRYWTWGRDLSAVEGTSFGSNKPLEPINGGYLASLWLHLPSCIVVMLPVALTGIVVRRRPREEKMFLLLLVITAVTWLSLLNLSSKQSWRYALPIVPALLVISAWGWEFVSTSMPRAAHRLVIVPIALLVYGAVAWSPNYFLYRSTLSGGLRGALQRSEGLPNFAPYQVLEFLRTARIESEPDPRVTLEGDGQILEQGFHHYFPLEDHAPEFGESPLFLSDYLLRFLPDDEELPPELEGAPPVYTFSFDGVDLVRLYRVPPTGTVKPLPLPFDGRLTEPGLDPRHDPRQSVLATYVRVMPGRYVLELDFERGGPQGADRVDPEHILLNIGLTRSCSRYVRGDEDHAELECDIRETRLLAPTVYWPRVLPIKIKSITLKRREGLQ